MPARAAKGGGMVAARCALALSLMLGWFAAVYAATPGDDAASVLERRIKAALLYRFINYVEWPDSAFASPSAPFTIAIAGADALAAELADFAAGRSVLNRPLNVRRLRSGESAKDTHIVFVGKEAATGLGAILRALPPSALVVSEWENALRQGSVINFVSVDGQVRFEISLEAAHKRNLRLSSRLLSVAHEVH